MQDSETRLTNLKDQLLNQGAATKREVRDFRAGDEKKQDLAERVQQLIRQNEALATRENQLKVTKQQIIDTNKVRSEAISALSNEKEALEALVATLTE